jgi:hypothetical protein
MHAYRTHEFGDSLFILRGQRFTCPSVTTTSDIPRGRPSEPASESGQTAGRSG